MKVLTKGSFRILEKRVVSDGDMLVSRGQELVLGGPRGKGGSIPQVPDPSHIFGKPSSKDVLGVARWYSGGYRDQTLLLYPLRKLMDKDLGPDAEMGVVIREATDCPEPQEFSSIQSQLSSYIGFVVLWYGLDKRVRRITLGLSIPHLVTILELIPSKLSEYISGETPRLHPTWACGIVLSYPPYPYSLEGDSRCLSGVKDLKHLFICGKKVSDGNYVVPNTLAGIATSWDQSLKGAVKRASWTLDSLSLESKQYRLDLVAHTQSLQDRLAVR